MPSPKHILVTGATGYVGGRLVPRRPEAGYRVRVLVRDTGQRFGNLCIEWRVHQAKRVTHLTQSVFFSPHGLPGFLYWILLYPFHWIRIRGLIQGILRQSQNP